MTKVGAKWNLDAYERRLHEILREQVLLCTASVKILGL